MIITISGPPGTGKSTLSKLLSQKLDIELISVGDIFRKMAKDRCMSLEELGMIAEKDEKIDKELDETQKKLAKSKKNLILEGRLSGFLIDADLKIWLKASLEIRAERIAKRESKSILKSMKETLERENCEKERYMKYYNIDVNDLSVYDLIIDSGKWKPEQICKIVLAAIYG